MFAILIHYGIPSKIVDAMKLLYDSSKKKVFFEGLTSKEFPITTRVLKGDLLTPILFIIVVDYVTKKSEIGYDFLTHKGKQQESIRKIRKPSTQIERKISY
ncbi:unnamed protein product [Brachionus calyciflorus]|uniref:Reverse transcriptase domain-containing protein n=1 Tax=Brachionus calyciflorus TaxID=104777 RepID=A0A813MC91_9BILA|nr:unnamed protein product [Brachionus calyciflorus]